MTGKYTKEHLEYTIRVFQKYYPYPITLDKAEEICNTMVSFAKPFIESSINNKTKSVPKEEVK